MSGHTPGPWYVREVGEGMPPLVQRRGSGGFQVKDTDLVRAMADARLIADAPVMREAIDDIRRVMEWHANGEASADFVVGWVRGVLQRLEERRQS
ncbi:MAG: hypothetical protein AB7P16_24960 [Bradyrhizobium sp.]|uniref:hypothetical protein n=1 Tax=Bradyrhizobium sp. TaxID=376 RepID=UPI003D139343